jgi:hypothetical protein
VTVAAAIVLSLLEDVDDDQVDPKAEVERLFDWQSKLAAIGFKKTGSAHRYVGMRREFNGLDMVIVLGSPSDVTAELEVQYYRRPSLGDDWVCDGTQTVSIDLLPELIKNFMVWLA